MYNLFCFTTALASNPYAHIEPDFSGYISIEKQVEWALEWAEKKIDEKEPKRKVFILFRPFVALGRYLRDAWREILQVRWPNRKATWKMVLAVLVYTALFVLMISLLDLFFTWLFNLSTNSSKSV